MAVPGPDFVLARPSRRLGQGPFPKYSSSFFSFKPVPTAQYVRRGMLPGRGMRLGGILALTVKRRRRRRKKRDGFKVSAGAEEREGGKDDWGNIEEEGGSGEDKRTYT